MTPSAPSAAAGPPGTLPWLLRRVPALASLRTYTPRAFAADLFAGLTVATVAVPQGLAYAIVAGLPPQYGLYTAIVVTAIGALFDSSRQLINGPTNAISIAVFSALAGVPEPERVQVAVVLALLIGLIQLGITVLRFGDLTRYVSHSVILGFTLGAAVLLFLGQLRVALGVPEGGSAHQSFLMRFFLTWSSGPPVHAWSALIAGGTIGLVLALQMLNRVLARYGRVRLPELLLSVIFAGILVERLGLDHRGVAVIGALPEHLPSFELPHVTLRRVQDHASQALAIALLGLLEAVAMAKAIAAYTRQRLDITQQCLSEALANCGGAFFQCFPGSGSLTRSAVNHQSGAASQWSGVFSALGVAATIVLFAPLAAYVPRAAIAGILAITAWRLVDRHEIAYFVRASRFDAIIIAATAISAVAISVEFCLLVGVLISFALYVPRAGAIHVTEMAVAGDRLIREREDDDPPCDRLAIFALEGEMFFGAAPDLERHLDELEARVDAGVKVVVLRVRELRNPDAVCLQLLDRFAARVRAKGAHLLLAGVRDHLLECLESSGAAERIGRENLFHAFTGPLPRKPHGAWRPLPRSGLVQAPGSRGSDPAGSGAGQPADGSGGASPARVASGLVRAVERAYELLGENRCASCPHSRTTEAGASPARWHQQI